jgi:hypothetical protein
MVQARLFRIEALLTMGSASCFGLVAVRSMFNEDDSIVEVLR